MPAVQEGEVTMLSRKVKVEHEFKSISALLGSADILRRKVQVPRVILRAAEALRLAVMRSLTEYSFLPYRETFADLDIDDDTGPDKVAKLLRKIVLLNDTDYFTHVYYREMVDFCGAVRSELIPFLQDAKEKGVSFRGVVSDYRSVFGGLQPKLSTTMFTFASMATCVFVFRVSFGNLFGRDESIEHDPSELLLTLVAASMPIWFKVPQRAYAFFSLVRKCTTELSRMDKLADNLKCKLQEVLAHDDTERRTRFTNVFFYALETRRAIGNVVFTYPEFSKIVGKRIGELEALVDSL